jgi:hypothetical protein
LDTYRQVRIYEWQKCETKCVKTNICSINALGRLLDSLTWDIRHNFAGQQIFQQLKKEERQICQQTGIKFTFALFGNGRGLVAQLVRAADS